MPPIKFRQTVIYFKYSNQELKYIIYKNNKEIAALRINN